ncbi:Flp pilus assembly protein CpaB [Methyloterricola oryzae]|uniref:Flp pilus assembly protein CpaB n=1 Tax=Methyloterricola oryzae TaxID=1495050 RepID=UPI0005EBC38A|nr:Flp pilus assembly protein CpaB [Methyloterricola oryzae]
MFTGRTFILFLGALILAFAAVFIAQRWVTSLSGGPVMKLQYGKVLVAAQDIPQWQKVEPSQVREVEWPKDAITSDMFTEKAQVLGKIAIDTVFADEPLNARRVLDPKGGNVFSLRIPEYMRAFTVRVNDVSGVGGFLLPDNHVDILASRKSGSGQGPTQAETIVQDIKVLAVDQEATSDKNKPIVVRSVTLQMTPQQAEAVFKAEEEGSIQLALRNPADAAVVEKTQPGPFAAHAPEPAPRPMASVGRSVTIIRGTLASKVRCNPHECSE